jgi:ornithine decarboxylase
MGKVINLKQAGTLLHDGQNVYNNSLHVLQQLKPDHPVYLFNRERLISTARNFQNDFPGRVAYAVKANTRKRVLRTLIAQGIREFDVASLAEIQRLTGISPPLFLHFNNPVKSRDAIKSAFDDYGVRSFALDDGEELDKILGACTRAQTLMLSVRFTLPEHQAAYDFGTKFGATPKRAVELLKRIQASGARAALTFHPGSQCTDANEYRQYIFAAAHIASVAGVELAQLNVGGGFPEYYSNVTAKPRQHYFGVIRQAIGNAFPGKVPDIICEPGRAMIASCISLMVKVIHVREDKFTAFINDGVYGGLQEQCLADLQLPIRAWRKEKRIDSPRVPYTVFGPTCDPSDRLPRALDLPSDLRPGDYLEFGLAGAYGSATATTFNGFESLHYVNVKS